MIVAVSLRLLYLIFQQVLGLVLLIGRPTLWVPKTRPTGTDLLLRHREEPGMIPLWRCS